jgi:hypothetical protein
MPFGVDTCTESPLEVQTLPTVWTRNQSSRPGDTTTNGRPFLQVRLSITS